MEALEDGNRPRPSAAIAAWAFALVAMTVVAYAPALRGGFVWDDDVYVTENPLVTEPGGLSRIWLSTDAPSQYFPLVYTTFRLEYTLWEGDPFGYHLVNVLLHAADALLLWWLLARLAVPGAWLAAAVFALHPVHVESVAWITERKNVLSLLFSLASLLAWQRFVEAEGRDRLAYAGSLALYALALASKTTACTLPLAMLLLPWWKGRPIGARRVAQVAPFVALGAAMGLVSIFWERAYIGTVGERFDLSWIEALLVASRALWFYLGKLVLPVGLVFSYPRFEVDPGDPLQYGWAVSGVALLFVLWHRRERIGRAPLASALFFIGTLAPLLGFVPLFTFWFTYVADHYQYVASIGPIALATGVSVRAARGLGPRGRRAAAAAAAPLLLLLGVLVWRQSSIYESEETLWRDTIAKHPDSWMARTNLGRALNRAGRFEEAIDAYRGALAVRPDTYRAHLGWARAALRLGRTAQAQRHLEEALAIDPDLENPRRLLEELRADRGPPDAAPSSEP